MKTQKTAGTSIEVDLSQRVEDAAIVTPIVPEHPGHEARNYMAADGKPRFRNHMPATAIRDMLGREQFTAMHRFCVLREPVAKALSHFHMLANSALHNRDGSYSKTWDQYVAAAQFPNDTDRVSETVDGRPVSLMTTILRYETLDRELPALLASLGIPDFRLTARAKSEYSRETRVARKDVTVEQARAIYRELDAEVALGGFYAAP